MTTTLEERAKAIVDYAWCKRTTEDPPLIDIALEHLRAVERAATKAAYERASDTVRANMDADADPCWNDALECMSRNIRALADGEEMELRTDSARLDWISKHFEEFCDHCDPTFDGDGFSVWVESKNEYMDFRHVRNAIDALMDDGQDCPAWEKREDG